MRPGDLREVAETTIWGECCKCRKIYSLDDLTPVTSPSATDWRFICPFCRLIASRNRPILGERARIQRRIEHHAGRDDEVNAGESD